MEVRRWRAYDHPLRQFTAGSGCPESARKSTNGPGSLAPAGFGGAGQVIFDRFGYGLLPAGVTRIRSGSWPTQAGFEPNRALE